MGLEQHEGLPQRPSLHVGIRTHARDVRAHPEEYDRETGGYQRGCSSDRDPSDTPAIQKRRGSGQSEGVRQRHASTMPAEPRTTPRYALRNVEPREIVCVCFGNICRSPMMEALLQRALDERFGPGAFLVTGAGIGADDGRPPSQGTVRAMERRGIDVRKHRSRFLTPDIARNAWRVYAAETYQVEHARLAVTVDAHHRITLFGEEVPDPLGSGEEAYEAVARQIERLLPEIVDAIADEVAREEAGNGPEPAP